MTLYLIVFIILAIILVAAAIFAIAQKDLLYAVLGTSVISLILSVFFFMLQAPDVALTEATIGVALTTIIFVITVKNTMRYEHDVEKNGIKKIRKK